MYCLSQVIKTWQSAGIHKKQSLIFRDIFSEIDIDQKYKQCCRKKNIINPDAVKNNFDKARKTAKSDKQT